MTPRIDNCVWAPHPGPQTEFLSDTSNELLYGGAAGGGKSDALIIDALGLNQLRPDGTIQHAISHPKYRAIIFRKQSTDLTEVIDRMLELYPQIAGCEGVKYFSSKKRFVFPSGARIELGSVNDPGDELRYKSRQFQYIGWEELTEHPTSAAYEYLMSRLRGPGDLPKFIRATTNPDGPGHTWVKKYWNIGKEGRDVPRFEKKVVIVDKDGTEHVKVFTRRFIAAKVSDNPSIDEQDPDYKFRLASMSEDKKRALLEGRWDIVNIAGVIFQKQLTQAIKEGRVGSYPYVEGHPVNTFWDFGANDATAIWCHQRIGGEDRFIDYFEDRHEPLSHYVRWLQEKKYVYGRHFLPHDAAARRLGADENKTIEEMLNDFGIAPTVIVPKIRKIAEGLEQARQGFSTAHFNEATTEAGMDALKNYRFADTGGESQAQAPLHNWASNGADAFRQYGQARMDLGDKPPLNVPIATTGVYDRPARIRKARQGGRGRHKWVC